MLCKFKSKRVYAILFVLGTIFLVSGIVLGQFLPEEAHTSNMMAGMLTGMGAIFTVVGAVSLIRFRWSSPEKLRSREIERSDERNTQITREASAVMGVVSVLLLAVMAVIFAGMDYREASYLSVAAMYVDIIAFGIARKVISKKI